MAQKLFLGVFSKLQLQEQQQSKQYRSANNASAEESMVSIAAAMHTCMLCEKAFISELGGRPVRWCSTISMRYVMLDAASPGAERFHDWSETLTLFGCNVRRPFA